MRISFLFFCEQRSSGAFMSSIPLPANHSPQPPPASKRWIISPLIDQLLILSTPLLAIPAAYLLHQPMGVQAKTIGLIVAAFFALGHHLPGMMRAYGDRELFERFKTRFILAPVLLFLLNFPLRQYHPDFIPLLIVFWATWHGLMQLYGFVRIYDSKVGSTSRATAWWDWLVCLCGFLGALLFCPTRLSDMMRHWYGLGGGLISPGAVIAAQATAKVLLVVVSIGFVTNYIYQYFRGVKPNPIKLLLLVSGIGTWWFAVVYIENIILGVAIFDICHDIQYLAIVWVFNCRRVSANPNLGSFMSFVFRRGMVLLYVGLIAAYGALGIIPTLVNNGSVILFMNSLIATSTLLHYYYDGFIWKVREKSTQSSLGLDQGAAEAEGRVHYPWDVAHLLKWSPLILFVGWLFLSDFTGPTLAQHRKNELSQIYVESLMGNAVLPSEEEEVVWVYSQFEQAQATAAAVPNDPDAQVRAAVMLANFGRNDEAVAILEKVNREHPKYFNSHVSLAEICLYRGQFDQAAPLFEMALKLVVEPDERAVVNLKLGEVYLRLNRLEDAREQFEAAMALNPKLKGAVERLQKEVSATGNPSTP